MKFKVSSKVKGSLILKSLNRAVVAGATVPVEGHLLYADDIQKAIKSELLLPIGGGTFINATLQNSSKVLYDIGEGIVIEKTIEDTIKNVDIRIKELQQTEEKISKMAQQIQDEATNAQNKAEKILSQNQK